MIRLLIILTVLVTATLGSAAQTPTPTPLVDDSDVQSWNDVSVSKAISPKLDVVFPFTLRIYENISRVREGRIGIGLAFKPHARVTLSPAYLFIKTRNSAGRFVSENRLVLSAGYRFPVKRVGLSHRSVFEYRIRPLRKTWRYRPSFTLEKSLPDKWIKGARVYVTEDPFYDSAAGRFSRNRLSFGFGKTVNRNLSVDFYYMRQDDRNSSPGLIHIIGSGWRVRL